jgi:hypothetical protein
MTRTPIDSEQRPGRATGPVGLRALLRARCPCGPKRRASFAGVGLLLGVLCASAPAAPLQLDVEGRAPRDLVAASADTLPPVFVPPTVVAVPPIVRRPADRPEEKDDWDEAADTEVKAITANDWSLPDLVVDVQAVAQAPTAHAGWLPAAPADDRLASDHLMTSGDTPPAARLATSPLVSAPLADDDEALQPAPEALPAAMLEVDPEQLRQQRSVIEWMVVPLVLVASLAAWFGGKSRSRRRRFRKVWQP